MQVRTKFTLMIAIVSFISTAFFTAFAYIELTDEIYDRIDDELTEFGQNFFGRVIQDDLHSNPERQVADIWPLNKYWIRVTDSKYQSFGTRLAQRFDLPAAVDREPYFITVAVPEDALDIAEEDRDEVDIKPGWEVKFRARLLQQTSGSETYTIHIAKPLPLLNAEIRELIYQLLLTIGMVVAATLLLSFIVAGKVLQPIKDINAKLQEINDSSLNIRIPLGKSKDEIYTLSSTLNGMLDRLQFSFQKQKQFVSDASHEMKSPLTTLMLSCEATLSMRSIDVVHKENQRQLAVIQRLSKLVRDLLDISRLEHQENVEKSPLEIKTLVEGVIEDYQLYISAKSIALSVNVEECQIEADLEQIRRVLLNLVDNGVKYNRESGGQLMIIGKHDDSAYILEIKNSGPLIPPEALPHIFDQFYRVEKSRSRKYGGTGLGLTIAKKIVTAHGGSLEASCHGNYAGLTTLSLTLPIGNDQ